MTSQPESPQANTFQRVANETYDIVTPANVIDGVALVGAFAGSRHLDKWGGIATCAASFAADVADGPVARGTGTQSELGEMVDATGDKIKLAFTAAAIWKHKLAPRHLISAVAIQNGINAVATTIDRSMDKEAVIHPSMFGKRAIFLQQAGLGAHVIGSKLEEDHPRMSKYVKRAGTAVGYTGVGLGIVASIGYVRALHDSLSDR
ncbi:MAG: CDP-alcohol phosphatidyltransferase family protein [Candidatus Saccharibacteria bacterium]|nr:CDP-alcohol phosphatidyltransferase family protein [Candidatus Saccharibacteria bacterium]